MTMGIVAVACLAASNWSARQPQFLSEWCGSGRAWSRGAIGARTARKCASIQPSRKWP